MATTTKTAWLRMGAWCILAALPAPALAYALDYEKTNPGWEESRRKLNEDFTVQEYQFRKKAPELSENTELVVRSQPRGDQSFALNQAWELIEGVELNHRIQMGLGREKVPGRPQDDFRRDFEETLTQQHQSVLKLAPSDWAGVTLSNQMAFAKREETLEESQRRDSAARASLKMTRDFQVDPYFQQTHLRQYNRQDSLRETLGVDMKYKLSRYTTLTPRFNMATQYDDLGRAAMRDQAQLGVQQVLYRKYLSLDFSPQYARQTRDWDEDYFLESYGMDNALTWTPLRGLSIRNGSQLLQQHLTHSEENQWRQRVFSEISHRPLANLNVRMRGEYDVSEKERDVDQFQDTTSRMGVSAEVSHQPAREIALRVRGSYQQEVREQNQDAVETSKSQLAFAFRPEYRINEYFATGAEFRYQYRDRGQTAQNLPDEEQVFMLNIIGSF